MEVARLMANETAKPRGQAAPTPDEAWAERTPIPLDERAALAAVVEQKREEVIRETHQDGAPAADDLRAWASIERIAISQALIALGYLRLRRRRIAPRIYRRRA